MNGSTMRINFLYTLSSFWFIYSNSLLLLFFLFFLFFFFILFQYFFSFSFVFLYFFSHPPPSSPSSPSSPLFILLLPPPPPPPFSSSSSLLPLLPQLEVLREAVIGSKNQPNLVDNIRPTNLLYSRAIRTNIAVKSEVVRGLRNGWKEDSGMWWKVTEDGGKMVKSGERCRWKDEKFCRRL